MAKRLSGRRLRGLATKLVDRPDPRAIDAQDHVAGVNVRIGGAAARRDARDEHALR
jgi:hypothetical protein